MFNPANGFYAAGAAAGRIMRSTGDIRLERSMRDWLLMLAPVGLVLYFVLFPNQFGAFMGWATHLLG